VFLNLGPMEVLVILVVALLVLGPAKLPEAARSAGRTIGELRRMSSGFQAELRDALQEPVDGFKPKSAELPTDGVDAKSNGKAEAPADERAGERPDGIAQPDKTDTA